MWVAKYKTLKIHIGKLSWILHLSINNTLFFTDTIFSVPLSILPTPLHSPDYKTEPLPLRSPAQTGQYFPKAAHLPKFHP